MEWVLEDDLAAYGARVLSWLERDPVLNTVPATVLTTRIDGTISAPGMWLAWLADAAGDVAGIALRTPPRGLLMSALPAGAVAALAALAQPDLPAASGWTDVVGAFGPGRQVAVPLPAGRAGPDRPGGGPGPTPGGGRGRRRPVRPVVRRLLRGRGRGSAPRLARRHRPGRRPGPAAAPGGRRPAGEHGRPLPHGGRRDPDRPVWTPPEHRRHGYATAATAELAGTLRRQGEVVLYADRANPTSNGIYVRIGFRPVGEWTDWRLEY